VGIHHFLPFFLLANELNKGTNKQKKREQVREAESDVSYNDLAMGVWYPTLTQMNTHYLEYCYHTIVIGTKSTGDAQTC